MGARGRATRDTPPRIPAHRAGADELRPPVGSRAGTKLVRPKRERTPRCGSSPVFGRLDSRPGRTGRWDLSAPGHAPGPVQDLVDAGRLRPGLGTMTDDGRVVDPSTRTASGSRTEPKTERSALAALRRGPVAIDLHVTAGWQRPARLPQRTTGAPPGESAARRTMAASAVTVERPGAFPQEPGGEPGGSP